MARIISIYPSILNVGVVFGEIRETLNTVSFEAASSMDYEGAFELADSLRDPESVSEGDIGYVVLDKTVLFDPDIPENIKETILVLITRTLLSASDGGVPHIASYIPDSIKEDLIEPFESMFPLWEDSGSENFDYDVIESASRNLLAYANHSSPGIRKAKR